jgi:hypothetical protein
LLADDVGGRVLSREVERKDMRRTTSTIALLASAILTVSGCSKSPAPSQSPEPTKDQSQPSSSTAATLDAIRTVICSLEPGETMMNPESSFTASADEEVALVTQKEAGGAPQYFAYNGGTRKGPFGNVSDAMAAAYKNRKTSPGRARDCAVYKPGPAPEGAKLTAEHVAGGGEAYRFGGSSFAPHRIVFSSRVTPDGALAYITAADNDKSWLEASDGRKVSFGGIPGEFAFSPDGRQAAVLVEGRYSMDEFNNLQKTPEKLATMAAEMGKKYIYTIDGKSYGPFDRDVSYWYARTSNDLFYRVGSQVFRNGSVMLTAESFDRCGFYPSPDGRTYGMFSYANITFSDGKTFPSPLDVVAYQDKGKTVVRWLAFENKKDLVVYQRPM